MSDPNLKQLEEYAEKVFDRLNYFNDYTLQTIGRRIKAVGQLSAHDQQTLKNMADVSGDMKAIIKKLAEITEMNISELEDIYTNTAKDKVNSYEPLYDFKNMEFIPFEKNEFAQQLVRHWIRETKGEMINLSRTKALCFNRYNSKGEIIGTTPLSGAFQKVMDDAVIAVSSGTIDFQTAMRETVKQLGGSGVRVDYGNNVTRELSSVIRQNVLYGAKRSAQAYDEYIGEQLKCDGFEVDAHAGCRPTHLFMQGKMYSNYGTVTIDGVTYPDGTEALERLNDYNCKHDKTSVILGVSVPRYSKEELDEIYQKSTELIEYDGKQKTLYEWTQVQRRFERAVRQQSSIRDMAKTAGNNVLANQCDEKIQVFRTKYDDLCKNVKGLEPKLDRMASYRHVNLILK